MLATLAGHGLPACAPEKMPDCKTYMPCKVNIDHDTPLASDNIA